MREWKSRLRIPRFVFPVTVLGLSLLLGGQPSFSDEKRPRQKPAKMLKGDFGRTLIPEVLELKNFQLLPPELFEKYDSRSIAESLVHRIRKSRWEINGTEDFYDLGGPRG